MSSGTVFGSAFSLDTDPNPTFCFDADSDSAFHFDADPDPDSAHQSCKSTTSGIQTIGTQLHFEPPRFYCEHTRLSMAPL